MALTDLLPSRKTETPTPPDPPEPPKSHRGLLEIGGRIPITWNTADPQSVERARLAFRSSLTAGYVAQSYTATKVVGWGGSRMDGEITREFNPEAEVVRMSLPYAGG